MIEFKNLSVNLGGVSILESVTANLPMGSSTAIVGPNGAGKTTLLLALLGEIPYSGEIKYSGAAKPRIGYVPQKLFFDREIPLTVLEFLALGLQRRPLWLGVASRVVRVASELLGLVNATDLISRRLGALSGGELQRVLLAKALARDPELLILDEPAAGVDLHGEMIFCELLERLRNERKYTQLMVSHDLATVSHHADHVICLNGEVITEGEPATVLTPENLAKLFGIHMGSFTPDGNFNLNLKKLHISELPKKEGCGCGGCHE